MWTLKDEAEGNTKEVNKSKFKALLEGLVGNVPTLETLEVGVKGENSPEDNQDIVLTTTHKDWEGLKAYATHPNHLKVVEFAKKVVASRAAVDFEY